MKITNPLKAFSGICWVQRLVRRLSRFAWQEMLWDVGRVEWKYGRTDDGKPKNWKEWDDVRVHLRETGKLRQPKELDSTNAESIHGSQHQDPYQIMNQKPNSEALQASHCSMSFEDWWNDQENGCPTLVLDNDEQFARAVWDAAINAATAAQRAEAFLRTVGKWTINETSAGTDASGKTL